MKLYLFNPDHDLALASNEPHYMPPATVRRMAEELALLPVWFAEPGSGVLASSAYNQLFLQELKERYGLQVTLVTPPEWLQKKQPLELMPWGWNRALCKQFNVTDECVASRRWLSSRERAVELYNQLIQQASLLRIGEMPAVLSTSDACRQFVECHERCVLKAPWSGSGKGLNWCKGVYTPSIKGWCERLLKEQGRVIAETVYDKVEDFALEYYCTGSEIQELGYSLFETNKSGAYSGNILLPQARIEKRLAEYVGMEVLSTVRRLLAERLVSLCAGRYTGYIGVDLMIVRLSEGTYAVHPCVEINLRMNMGIVSLFLQRRLLAPGSEGYYQICYYPTHEALMERHLADAAAHPVVTEGGRLKSGYQPLVPVTPHSQYLAFVTASPSLP